MIFNRFQKKPSFLFFAASLLLVDFRCCFFLRLSILKVIAKTAIKNARSMQKTGIYSNICAYILSYTNDINTNNDSIERAQVFPELITQRQSFYVLVT